MRGLKTTAGVLLASAVMASAQPATNWVAFNDHNTTGTPAPGTGANVTLYHLGGLTVVPGGGPGGPLTNRNTGEQLAATLFVSWTGGDGPDNFGASMDANTGSPAYELFNGIVDIGGAVAGAGGDDGIIGLRSSEMNVVTMTFSNLDVSQRYIFRGTSVRGNPAYVDRWAYYEIQAASYVDAHVDGSANLNLFTADTFPGGGLAAGQVALNSGGNLEGSLVGWNDIVPNPDGTINIVERQFIGTAPFGTPSAGPYGYGMNAIMLAEVFSGPPSAPLIVTQPAGVTNSEGQLARLQVIASGTPPLAYQWYSGTAPGGVPIAGATRSALNVTNMAGSGKTWSVPGDSGNYYVVVTGALSPPATSATVKVQVNADTTPPAFLYATCDPTDLHVVTLTLSEPVVDDDNLRDTLNWTVTSVVGGNELTVTALGYTPGSTTITFTNFFPRDPALSYRITMSGNPLVDRAIAQNTMPPLSSILINCVETELLALNASWRYLDNDVDPGANWFGTGYADGGWSLGTGVFDAKRDAAGTAGQNCRDASLYNLGSVGTCIKLTSPVTMTNLLTAYFRTHFFFGGDPTTAILDANGKFDDGAIVYLNGVELARVGVAPAPAAVVHNTLASRGVGDTDAQDTGRYVFPASLVNGDNVLAVGLHQQNLTSSDLTMGLRIVALTRVPLTVAGPRISIASEGANVRIKWTPASGTLQFTDVLSAAPAWQDQTTGQVGPAEYLIPRSQLPRFYSLRQ